MDFTTVASSTYDEGCVVVSMEELTMPRVAGRQVHRDNVEAESASQYYQRSIFFSYINGLSSSLRERFNNNPSFFVVLSILPLNDPSKIDQIENLHALDNLASEVRLWRNSLTAQVNQESLSELFLRAQAYPSVRNVIQIIMKWHCPQQLLRMNGHFCVWDEWKLGYRYVQLRPLIASLICARFIVIKKG